MFLSTIVCSFCPFCFDHCIVCTLTCGFWLHLWCLLTIVLSVLWLTASDYTFGIFWPLYCLYFDLRLLITPLVSFDHCIVCTLMASVYTFGIFRTSLIMEAWHNHSENTLNSQQNSQTLQDLFDITIRYYQNSFDTWDDEQHWNFKKCSRHVMDISVHLYFIVLIVFCMYSIFNLL